MCSINMRVHRTTWNTCVLSSVCTSTCFLHVWLLYLALTSADLRHTKKSVPLHPPSCMRIIQIGLFYSWYVPWTSSFCCSSMYILLSLPISPVVSFRCVYISHRCFYLGATLGGLAVCAPIFLLKQAIHTIQLLGAADTLISLDVKSEQQGEQ